MFVYDSVAELEDIEGIAAETDCLSNYVAKGIALGCFVYARCLHHGYGVEQDVKESKLWYSRVSITLRPHIIIIIIIISISNHHHHHCL